MSFDFSEERKKRIKSKNRYIAISVPSEVGDKITEYAAKESVKKSQFTRKLVLEAISAYESQIPHRGRPKLEK